jgi:uncharacterized protein (DUF488 family)
MASVYTVGHSNRSTDEFLALLAEHDVACLIDVRRFPGSKRHPHFTRETLAASLARAGIAYVHEEALGGYRKEQPDSPNTAWESAGFRGYADYMSTTEFQAALDRLTARAVRERTAFMCAEAEPQRCHRQLIADAVVAGGSEVVHILSAGKAEDHSLNPNARVMEDGSVVYPAPPSDQVELFPD